MDRVILHCDCNSFFASVESVLEPSLRLVPMAVCGSQEERHGIVLAKNELAKKYGIETAETVVSAKRKCPDLVIVEPHRDEYVKFSKRVNEIYREYTDLVEPFGIDESWLDVTASQRLFGSGVEIAEQIRKRVKAETGLTVSIGVSFNKIFAKLGSDYKKPDAITVISRENFREIVFPLHVTALLYVGASTSAALNKMGIRTIGELAFSNEELMAQRLGKIGPTLVRYARGLDDSPVVVDDNGAVKSISNGLTFKRDLVNREECRIGIDHLCWELGYKLRRKGLKCSTVILTVKDHFLSSKQRQRQLEHSTDVGREIADLAYTILCDFWDERKPVRMITVGVTGLIEAASECIQLDFFTDGEPLDGGRERKKEETVDIIRERYGDGVIYRGSIMEIK